MDLLKSYSGGNSSEDDTITAVSRDYFGLDQVDTDDDEVANPVAGLDVRVYTDTFRLSKCHYGPTDPSGTGGRGSYTEVHRKRPASTLPLKMKRPKAVCDDVSSANEISTNVDWEAVFKERYHYSKSSSKNECRIPDRKSFGLKGHGGCVSSLEWGKCGHLLLSASLDGSVRIWDVDFRKNFVVHKHAAGVKRARWFHDKSLVLSVGYDQKASLTDVISGKNKSSCEHPHYATCLELNENDRQTFLTGSRDCVFLWDVRLEEPVRRYSYLCGQVLDILLLPGKQEFVCSTDLVSRDSADRTLMAWDLRSGALLSNQIYSERYTCPCLRSGPDPTQFLAQSNGGYVAVFSTRRPYKLDKCKRYEGHKVMGYSIGFDVSRDNRFLVSGDAEGRLHYYGIRTQWTRTVPCSKEATVSVVWHPLLESTLAVGTWDGEIQLWR